MQQIDYETAIYIAFTNFTPKPARPKSKYSPHGNSIQNVAIQRFDPFLATVSLKSQKS